MVGELRSIVFITQLELVSVAQRVQFVRLLLADDRHARSGSTGPEAGKVSVRHDSEHKGESSDNQCDDEQSGAFTETDWDLPQKDSKEDCSDGSAVARR